jgi:hypothetical protein
MKKSIVLFCLIWLFANASCNKTKKEEQPDVPSTADSTFGFGSAAAHHYLRFDPTNHAGYEISIKNLRIETDE